jgi:hypothetical protein
MSSNVSTVALGPILVVTVIAVVIAAALMRGGGSPQPAMRPVRTGRGGRVDPRRVFMLLAESASRAERRPAFGSREWWADAIGLRGPEPAHTGDDARTHWWQRLRSALLLLLLLVVLGVALAAVIGALVFLAGFFLELAVK